MGLKKTTTSWLLILVVWCSVVGSNIAGVIKKRELDLKTATKTDLINKIMVNLTEVQPTILTAIPNKSGEVVTTKLQLVAGKNLVTESSKELSNNEILINEAKKLLEEEDKIMKTNKEAEIFKENTEKIEELKLYDDSKENLLKLNNLTIETKPDSNLKDIKEIILNLENKEQQLTESTKISSEFGRNKIKDITKENSKEKSEGAELEEQKNSSSLENTLKGNEEIPKTETETEAPNKKPKIQETQLENSIESLKNNDVDKIEIITLKTITTTPAKIEELREKVLNNHNLKNEENEKEASEIKTLETETNENERNINVANSNPLEATSFTVANKKETSTTEAQSTENLEVMEITTIYPYNDLNTNLNKINQNFETTTIRTIIQDGVDLQELLNSKIKTTTFESSMETTLQPDTKESDLLIFEGEKKEYARSMFKDESTTLSPTFNNEIIMPITTYRPVILSVKEENLKDHIDVEPFNIKEKKPKFINDNSTNAQQLNLPNNAEVWYLASMKSLPKSNVTLKTGHENNQTISKDFKENLVNNSMTIMNANSEKNLLDWSQIMRDKELATTTRNEMDKENDENELITITTLRPELTTTTDNNSEFRDQEEVTLNTFIDLANTNTTNFSTTKATILSFANDNINKHKTDKNIKENMNNHLEMIRENLDVATTTNTTTTTTTGAKNLVNNPFNTTLNIETNLNEINLTLNHTQQQQQQKTELNNEVHITQAAGKPNNDNDVITVPTTTTLSTLTTTTTEATAVVDMTKVEQISSETTTVSTLETSNQNVSLNNTNPSHIENKTNINVNSLKSNYSAEHNELEIVALEKLKAKTNNQYYGNKQEENEEDFKIKSTTTVLPITTFRPSILAITSTTSIPITFQQEVKVDQNGNNAFQINLTNSNQQQQPQSVIQTDLNVNNSIKINETHLLVREFETTTIEIPTTTAATIKTLILNETKTETENNLTSSGEINTTTSTYTSSSQEVAIINETTERILETKETITTQSTPKTEEETTIVSAVVSNKEQKVNKVEPTTTTETVIILTSTATTTSITTEIAKTPVVFESSSKETPTTETQEVLITTTTAKPETEHKKDIYKEKDAKLDTKTMSTSTTSIPVTVVKDDETYISLLDDTTTTTQIYSPAISLTTTAPTKKINSTTPQPTASPPSSSTITTLPSAITTKVEEIYNVIHSTTTELIQTEIVEDLSSSTSSLSPLYPTSTDETTTLSSNIIDTADIGKSLPTLTSIMGGNSGNMYPKNTGASGETDVNVIIAITVSVIGVIALILLVGFLYLMRKRQKQNSYPNRCRPVSMDEFTIDNVSVGGSMRKSSALRSSKRTYGNLAFDDPSLRHNPMGVHELAKFVQEKLRIFEEFRDVPQITSRLDEVPPGCEDKNRYANVLPLPETRVILQRLNDDDKTEYINANYVTGPKDSPNYYIACQAPIDSTVEDFWRMIWEQQSRVIIQATDLIENGVEKCAEYLPPSVTLDNHSSFGDFQITLQNRDVKDKYAISTLLLKNVNENASRELTHYWYKWPEVGVPSEEAPIIAMLLEARSSLISYAIEQTNDDKEKSSMATLKSAEEGTAGATNRASPENNNSNGSSANGSGEINGNISMVHIKKTARNQGPLTIHCSPGTGRTGTIIACDIAIRSLETPKRTVDIPQIVYYVRRGRASAVLTKEQYEFIYKVANMYAAKITNPTNYN